MLNSYLVRNFKLSKKSTMQSNWKTPVISLYRLCSYSFDNLKSKAEPLIVVRQTENMDKGTNRETPGKRGWAGQKKTGRRKNNSGHDYYTICFSFELAALFFSSSSMRFTERDFCSSPTCLTVSWIFCRPMLRWSCCSSRSDLFSWYSLACKHSSVTDDCIYNMTTQ